VIGHGAAVVSNKNPDDKAHWQFRELRCNIDSLVGCANTIRTLLYCSRPESLVPGDRQFLPDSFGRARSPHNCRIKTGLG
jgi:hypothetical protein